MKNSIVDDDARVELGTERFEFSWLGLAEPESVVVSSAAHARLLTRITSLPLSLTLSPFHLLTLNTPSNTPTGHVDGSWTVDLPAAEVPPEMPEPVLGINFARNGMNQSDWLSLCAIHSDSWLMSLLFFFGARFNCTGRAELFALANQHPTIYEVVSEKVPRNVMYKRQDGGESALHLMMQGGSAAGQQVGMAPLQGDMALGSPDGGRRALSAEPAIRSEPSGKIIGPEDFSTALCGQRAELFWPDDQKWYLVEIQAIDMETKMAKVRYATQEEEELNLLEVIEDGQMSLLG